jgi:hypothetical protein
VKQARIVETVKLRPSGLGLISVIVVLAAAGVFTINPQGLENICVRATAHLRCFFRFCMYLAAGLTATKTPNCRNCVLFVAAAIFWRLSSKLHIAAVLAFKDFTDRTPGGPLV